MLRLLAVTGMRPGEALGLKWEDVDFARGTVTVRRSVDVRKRRLKPEGDEAKTAGRERTIKLDEETLAALAELKRERTKGKVSPCGLTAAWCSATVCASSEKRKFAWRSSGR